MAPVCSCDRLRLLGPIFLQSWPTVRLRPTLSVVLGCIRAVSSRPTAAQVCLGHLSPWDHSFGSTSMPMGSKAHRLPLLRPPRMSATLALFPPSDLEARGCGGVQVCARVDEIRKRAPATSSTTSGSASNRALECLICMDAPRASKFSPCGHVAACTACAQLMLAQHRPCPVCRSPLSDVVPGEYYSTFAC